MTVKASQTSALLDAEQSVTLREFGLSYTTDHIEASRRRFSAKHLSEEDFIKEYVYES